MNPTTFRQFARHEPDATAIIDASGRRHARGAVLHASDGLMRALRAQGARPGDVLAILAPNCVEFLTTYFAARQLGMYVVPLNWHLSRDELGYILADSGAAVLVAHEKFARHVDSVVREDCTGLRVRISIGDIPGFMPMAAVVAGREAEPLPDDVMGRVMMYTSATTGRPKGVSLPLTDERSAHARTFAFYCAVGIGTEDANVHLCASMLYHAAPLEAAAMALHMGHCVVLVEHWTPENLLELIETHRVTTSFMVPSMFVRLLKLPDTTRARYSTRSLRFVVHGAAPCPDEVKRKMIEWWGPVLWETYGAAEGAGTFASSEDWLSRPGTVGRAIPGSTIKILDDDGNELPRGQPGMVYLTRYTGDKFSYRGDPAKTKAAYRGGFFTVGDVGYMDDEDYLYLCDRRVDVILCGGFNVYSSEIEQHLVQHPAVADCAVFGVPDEAMGEAIRAVVQPLRPAESGRALAVELLRFLSTRLSLVKLPRRIDFVDSLPRDPTGKLFKRRLREEHWREHARRM